MLAINRTWFEGKLTKKKKVVSIHNLSSLQNLAVIDVLDEAKTTSSLESEFKNVKFLYKKCSVTDEAELRKCMNEIKGEMGSLDVIVNSAGVLDETNPKRTIDINYVRILVFCL